MHKDIVYLKGGLDFLKYELVEDLQNIFIPHILSPEETVQRIINNKSGIARFGDGEFLLMKQTNIGFQDSSPLLAERLREVLTTKLPNLDIGLSTGMCHSTCGQSEWDKRFNRIFWGENADWIVKLLDKNYVYSNTGFTILPNSEERFNHIRQIWDKRDIAVISGDRVFKKLDYNVFDNANTIEYISAPTTNAFFKYDKILTRAGKINKDKPVFIILGPTATVLAYDLAKEGYQAIDIGHIVKSYDAFRKNHNMTSDYLNKFFAKD